MLEVHEGILRPQSGLKLFARHDPPFRLQEQPQHAQRHILYGHTHARAEQFIAAQIDLKAVKACTRPTQELVSSQPHTPS
jgi:hypothetical protein